MLWKQRNAVHLWPQTLLRSCSGAMEVMGDTDRINYPSLSLRLGGLPHGNLTLGMNKMQERYPSNLRRRDGSGIRPQGRVWRIFLEKDRTRKAVVRVGSEKQLGLQSTSQVGKAAEVYSTVLFM